MNLNFSILWYDDDKDFFDSIDMEPIESEIASWGFSLEISAVHNSDELRQHMPFDQFDMLVVDFKLGGDEHGDKFIKDVRDQNVFSEIIFYSTSASRELWQAVHDQQLEGVFVTNKGGIHQKLIRVAQQSVRKVLDLENMRGIVMSEVGDLDALLEDIFIRAMDGISEEQQHKVFTRFHEKTNEQNIEFLDALTTFKDEPSIDGLLRLCDSDKRWQSFNRVKKHNPLVNNIKFVGDYQLDVLSPRNFLAHGTPERRSDGSFLFRHRGKEYSFDETVSQDLRKKIMAYKTAFADISEALV